MTRDPGLQALAAVIGAGVAGLVLYGLGCWWAEVRTDRAREARYRANYRNRNHWRAM